MSQTSTRLSLGPFSLSVTDVEVELLSAGLLMFAPMGLTQCENPSETKTKLLVYYLRRFCLDLVKCRITS